MGGVVLCDMKCKEAHLEWTPKKSYLAAYQGQPISETNYTCLWQKKGLKGFWDSSTPRVFDMCQIVTWISQNLQTLSSYIFLIVQLTPWLCAIYSINNVHAEAMYLRAQEKQNVPLRETCSRTTGLHAF